MSGDYIKLSRKILEWDWYSDINTCRLFIHMILRANWKEGNFRGKVIPRGSFVSSIGKLSEETGLTQDEVRTAVKHLICTKEITKQSTNKFTVFTLNNYELYQCIPKQDTEQSPSSPQAIPKLFPTIEEGKKGRREEYIYACENFEKFWTAYPRKSQRKLTEKQYAIVLRQGISESCLINAAKNYAESCKIIETPVNFVKNPSNWLRDGTWSDYTEENYRKPEKKQQKSNSFNNFEQRDYDYAALEKELLGAGRCDDG